jgi:hypothetical protein
MRRIAALVALLALVAGVFWVRSVLAQPSDEALIRAALSEAAAASQEGRPGGVFDLLSRSLEVNQSQVRVGRDLADFIRNARPRVEFLNPAIEVIGNEARVVSDVSAQLFPMPRPVRLERVTVHLAKEPATRWLVVPVTRWRVTRIDAPEANLRDFVVR